MRWKTEKRRLRDANAEIGEFTSGFPTWREYSRAATIYGRHGLHDKARFMGEMVMIEMRAQAEHGREDLRCPPA